MFVMRNRPLDKNVGTFETNVHMKIFSFYSVLFLQWEKQTGKQSRSVLYHTETDYTELALVLKYCFDAYIEYYCVSLFLIIQFHLSVYLHRFRIKF